MGVMTGLGLMLGAYGAIDTYMQGTAMRKDALKGLEEFRAQDLTNAYASLSPSLEAERTALNTFSESQAGLVDVAGGMDASDALAVLSTGNEQIQKGRLDQINRMIDKKSEFDILEAQDDVALRNMEEARDMFEIQSLQAQLSAGNQMRSDALMGGAKMMVGAGNAYEDRMAGLGVDKKAYKQELKRRLRMAESGMNVNNGQASDVNLNLNLENPGINLLNPDGSLRFNLLSE
jgi:hypothetical protein